MSALHLEFDVAGDNFLSAGSATDRVKNELRKLGVSSADIRRVAISMYEGEINMVIHAGGGKAIVDIYVDKSVVKLIDHGKGIKDIELAMKPGYSTANEEIRNLGFGAGMGLPNMKKYADELIIESEVGKGTTVTMIVNFS
ncbi:MAG: ATP-binding protein [Clostridia bacterium]|nr:ATP-binding protein [Clostridia bacterium]